MRYHDPLKSNFGLYSMLKTKLLDDDNNNNKFIFYIINNINCNEISASHET